LRILCLLVMGATAQAAEIKVLCANGMQAVMEDLGPRFERASGHRLSMAFATGGAASKRAIDGEAVDVVIAPTPGIEALVKAGLVAREDVAALASTGISVAVRQGTAKPDISSPEALRRALLSAKSITYLDPADGGASGIHFARVLDRLAIGPEMKAKTVFAPKADAVGAMVARGEAEIGVLQYQLLFSVPGIEIVGPLPGDLQNSTIFAAAILSGRRDAVASRTLTTYLRTPEAAAVIKAKGMEFAPQP
jgi:molybdate transport system substrate-binding protein